MSARLRRLLCAWVLALLAGAPAIAFARPGGGHSFGGGGGGGGSGGGSSSHSSGGSHSSSSSSHSSGGGSMGGGDLPLYIVCLGLGIGLLTVNVLATLRGNGTWTSVPETLTFEAPQVRRRVSLEPLARHDPNFSRVLLDDFLHELYGRAQQARGDAEALARLAPYLSTKMRARLATRGRAEVLAVTQVVVASSEIVKLQLPQGSPSARMAVRYEASFTEVYAGDARPRVQIYARETWWLVRKLGAPSRPPDQVLAFNCPQCGAPVEVDERNACKACGAAYEAGAHEWSCVDIQVASEETMPPSLGGYQPERGGELPTRRAQGVDIRLKALATEDPSFAIDGFEARVQAIYHRLNAAWSSLRWQDVRPYCSDRFWLAQTYWIEAYRAQGLVNRMQDARVLRMVVADASRDAFFWAITVRVFATAIDTTVHAASGRQVGGSTQPRAYTEYWTMIRSVARKGEASTSESCPSCGAPLTVGMTGNCEHCGVKVTGGAFDWVLSKIEQDDTYQL